MNGWFFPAHSFLRTYVLPLTPSDGTARTFSLTAMLQLGNKLVSAQLHFLEETIFNPQSEYNLACLTSGSTAKGFVTGNRKNKKYAPLLSDLTMDTLLLIEEKKARLPGGFELGTSRLRDRSSKHFATTRVYLHE